MMEEDELVIKEFISNKKKGELQELIPEKKGKYGLSFKLNFNELKS